jgi:hypothetical protein
VKLATLVMKHRSELETGRWTVLLVAPLALCMTTSHGHGYQLQVPTDHQPWPWLPAAGIHWQQERPDHLPLALALAS